MKIKNVIKLIFLAVIIVGFWVLITFFGSNNADAVENFVIPTGAGVNEISMQLYEAGLIDSKLIFETWLWLSHSEGQVQAGIYTFPANISIYELSNILFAGPGNSQQALTILEGWDRRDISKYFDEKNYSFPDFMTVTAKVVDWKEDYSFLADAPSSASLEGYIFPDTYFVDQNTDTNSLLTKALNNFDNKVREEIREEIKRQGKTIFEVITLASIIELEVPLDQDKKMIADVFLKRLKDNIGLQSDATINFITGKGHTRPLLADLEIDSPYNTYKYRGLTPGPISNPGLASIEAVVYPTPNDYYYFLTDPEGKVYYARNFEEHQQNRQNYLE